MPSVVINGGLKIHTLIDLFCFFVRGKGVDYFRVPLNTTLQNNCK
jgi:hypothetical protein